MNRGPTRASPTLRGLPTSKPPPSDRPYRVLVVSGSDRCRFERPRTDSESRVLMFRMAGRLPQECEADLEDLGNVWKRAQVGPCNGRGSSSGALCVWPCDCHERENRGQPDLVWDLDLHARLDQADAWAIIGPVARNGPAGDLKAMFDRVVSMNVGNPKANPLKGRSAGFFCYGDGAGDEDMRDAYGPLVRQARQAGIDVPDALWRCVSGSGVHAAFDAWVDELVAHVAAKGRIGPGASRAYGNEPPSHLIADLETNWRGGAPTSWWPRDC